MRPTPLHQRFSPVPLALAFSWTVALAAGHASPALAQSGSAAAVAPIAFDIPAQSLAGALNELARQANLQMTFPAALVADRQAPAIRGTLTTQQALDQLLAGQGLVGSVEGASVVVLQSPAQRGEATLPTVTVRSPSVFGVTQNLDMPVKVGALGNVIQRESPFSSAVVTDEQIQEQASLKLGDLFIQDAAVTDNSGANTAWGTYLTVRGMDLDWQNSYRIDGKPFLGYTVTLPYEHMEQVELLKGATGFMYGFGAPGGMVNYVTKKPTASPTRSVGLGYVSNSIARANVDLSGRLGGDGAVGYRLGVTHETGRTPNDGSLRRTSLLLALEAKLTDRLSLDFQALYQDRLTEDTEPTITTRLLGNRLPGVIRTDRKLVGPGNFVDNQFGFAATGLRYRLNDRWQAQTTFSQSYSKTRRNESVLNLQDAVGAYRDDRADYGERYQLSYWDATLQGSEQLAGMTHHLVAGLSWQVQRNDDSRNAVYIPGFGTGSLGVQNTNRYDSIGSFDSLGIYRLTEVTQQSLFASDRVELNERWSVLGGLRWTRYEKRNWNGSGAAEATYRESGILTPTAAVMLKLSNDTLAYLSYVESLQQGAIVSSLPIYSNAGDMLNPLKSRQWELGVKKDTARWSGSAALFRVAKTTEYDRSCGGECLTRVQDGESVFQGLELGATARLSNAWSLGGSLMLLDSEFASGEAAIEGNRVPGAPRRVATAQIAYRVPQINGLQVRLGAKYTSSTPLRVGNSLDVDAYTVASLGASYDTLVAGQAVTFRANVNNLFDRKYWMYQYSNYIKAGDSRTITLSATLRF